MTYIPADAKWYLAEIVEEFVIEGHEGNLVHTNMVLIKADSPEEAYQRAEEFGRTANMTYTNPEGETVVQRYRGLRDLNVIHGELEHGTELTFQEHVGISERDLAQWISAKKDLGVFKR